MSKSSSPKMDNLLIGGFGVFLCGATLATTQSNTILRIIGVILLIIAAMLFGASMERGRRNK